MFNSSVLDIAISLAFTYLLLAIICSSINEWILNSVLKSRAKDLQHTMQNLLFDPSWKDIAGKIIKSPFITSLKRTDEKFPSYIPARNFVLAFMETVKEGAGGAADASGNVPFGRSMLDGNNLIVGDAKKVLVGLLDKAGEDRESFMKGLEQFYNDAMERAGGWYKRKAKRIVFILGIVIVFALNVDTIRITKAMWEQPDLAKQTADIAANSSFAYDTSTGSVYMIPKNVEKTDTVTSITTDTAGSGKKTVTVSNQQIKHISDAKSAISALPLPIGWVSGNYPSLCGKFDFWGWVSKLVGLMITAGAISLGAPFWFDLMNKFINLRTAGKKPEDGKDDKKEKNDRV